MNTNKNSAGINNTQKIITVYLFICVLIGLVLAYVGLIVSAGKFLREGLVVIVGIPGLLGSLLGITGIVSKSAKKRKITAIILTALYFICTSFLFLG